MLLTENTSRPRFLCLALTLLLLAFLLTDCKAQSSQKVDWDKLLKAWNAYLDYPSSENADKITALLPDSGYIAFTNVPKEDSTFNSIWQSLSILEHQIYASDSSAINLAFHLFSIADGGFAEALDIILGNLIRINAQLFLQELLNNRPLIMRLDALVGNLGSEYSEKVNAERLEVNLRIRALEKVKDQNIRGVRDQCIRTLKEP